MLLLVVALSVRGVRHGATADNQLQVFVLFVLVPVPVRKLAIYTTSTKNPRISNAIRIYMYRC